MELVLSGCSSVANYVRFKNASKFPHIAFDRKGTRKFFETKWENIPEFPTLAELLAEHYGMKPTDLSYPGSGNRRICNTLVDYVIENHHNIGIVIACWSSFSRFDFELANGLYDSLSYFDYDINENIEISLRDHFKIFKEMLARGYISPEADINQFLRGSIVLDAVCKQFGVKCIQAVTQIRKTHKDIKYLRYFMDHKLFDAVNTETFYGRPIFEEIGGKLCRSFDDKYSINEYDSHPNKLGHEKMAEILKEFIG